MTQLQRAASKKTFWVLRACLAGMQTEKSPAVGGRSQWKLCFKIGRWWCERWESCRALAEYEQTSQYSQTPLVKRFGTWGQVPHGLKQYIEERGTEEEWKDILEKIAELDMAARKNRNALEWNCPAGSTGRNWNEDACYGKPSSQMKETLGAAGAGRMRRGAMAGGFRFGPPNGAGWRAKVLEDRPIYGPLMNPSPLAHGPTNEMGVLFLFGTVAAQLGFVVTWVRSEFPDCEAMILVGPEKWQRIRIEFEYESRNFLKHMHDAKECDLIVCWRHNWPECPVEVLELSVGDGKELRRNRVKQKQDSQNCQKLPKIAGIGKARSSPADYAERRRSKTPITEK